MNKLKTILFLILYCLFSTAIAQQVEWKKNIVFSYPAIPTSITYSNIENNFVFSGSGDFSGIISRLRLNGDTSYFKKYYPTNKYFGISKVQSSNTQNVVYAKTLLTDTSTFEYEQNISKFNKEGNLIWRTSYNLLHYNTFRDFMVLPNGSSFVTGYWQNPPNDMYLVRVDNNGTLAYEQQFTQFGFQYNTDMELQKDGSIWIGGSERPFTNFSYEQFMYKVDTDGNFISKDTLPDFVPSDTTGFPKSMSFTADNHILFEWVTNTNQSTIIKTDTNYNIIWQTPSNQKVTNPRLLDDSTVFTYGLNNVKLYNYYTGALEWSYSFTDTNGTIYFKDYAFDDSNNVVLAASLYRSSSDQDMYFAKISGIGSPIQPACENPPTIHAITADIIGVNQNKINLGDSATENLKYSDILAHNWYFEDGQQAYGQFINHEFDPIQYPTSFWCMLVVTDATGCTDTMTIDAYTGEIIENPNWPPSPPDTTIGINEEIALYENNLIIYPNPFTETFTINFPSLLGKYDRGNLSINMYDILGKKILNQEIPNQVGNDAVILDGSQLQKGIYIVEVEGVGRSKIVKQ